MTKIDTSTEAIAAIIKAHDEGRPHDCKGFTALELAARDLVPALTAERDALRAERERLSLAICGGEDAPGYAGAQTVEALESVAMQNRNMHAGTVNSLLRAETERDTLRADVERLRAELSGAADAFAVIADHIMSAKGTYIQPNHKGIFADCQRAGMKIRAAMKGAANG